MTKKTVLVVDDSESIRHQIAKVLVEAGFEVAEAEDGIHGLETIRANPTFSLIFSDINMPRMGGLEMIEEIHRDNAINMIPIVMLTTEGSPKFVERARGAGAKGWIVKPFDPAGLVATANAVIEKCGPKAA